MLPLFAHEIRAQTAPYEAPTEVLNEEEIAEAEVEAYFLAKWSGIYFLWIEFVFIHCFEEN